MKYHVRCTNEAAHTQAGADEATIILNASESTTGGFVYHCRHGHCDGIDRLVFVRKNARTRLAYARRSDGTHSSIRPTARPTSPKRMWN